MKSPITKALVTIEIVKATRNNLKDNVQVTRRLTIKAIKETSLWASLKFYSLQPIKDITQPRAVDGFHCDDIKL